MARRSRGPKGAAWNTQVLTSSMAARRGGPVYRNLASITRFSSRQTLYHAAKRNGWGIVRIGRTWVLYDRTLPIQVVLGPRPPRGSA
jgi:hypothetical protein